MDRLFRLATSSRFQLASKVYPPLQLRDVTSKVPIHSASQRAMLENGLIEHAGNVGLFHVLPLGVRALDKLSKVIVEEMDAIGAQRVQLSSLVGRRFLDRTDRWSKFGKDLFRVQDRIEEEYCLAPTHEESITDLVSTRLQQMSADSTPLLLYQMTSKFRDESKSRYGLLRCREFLMMDLYSFDVDEERAKKTYDTCSRAYRRIFETRLGPLKKPLMRVLSDVGAMGGTLSHEYHLENDCGEDRIDFCSSCDAGMNRELMRGGDANDDQPSICSGCRSEMKSFKSVEIGHTFLLGTKYSEAFNAAFSSASGRTLAFMGCYGIGVTRLLAALVDCNLTKAGHLRWPLAVAPYLVCLIPPKEGSKEEKLGGTRFSLDVLRALDGEIPGEVIFDDRTDLTVGRRLLDAKRIGYPFVIVANKTVVHNSIPKFEFFDLTGDDGEEKMELLTHEELFARIRSLCGIL